MRWISTFREFQSGRERDLRERGIFTYFGNRSGYVIVIVLMLVSLIFPIATEFIRVAQTNIGFSKKLNGRLKASYMAKSGIQLAKLLLYLDLKGVTGEQITGKPSDKDTDSYNDIWAIEAPEFPICDDCGTIKLKIIDENSKINLSLLANEYSDTPTKFYYWTQNFFMNMGFPPDIADAIVDWVDIDDSRMPYGAEGHDYYMNLPVPYPCKNNAMDSIDELLMVKDMTPMIYYGLGGGNFESEKSEQSLVDDNRGKMDLGKDKMADLFGQGAADKVPEKNKNKELVKIGKEKSRALSDYFTVYGERGDYNSDFNKININTASYRVLSALTDKMTPDIVTEIINRRLVRPYKTVDEIADLVKDNTIRDRLSTKSFVFRIISTATVDDVQVKITAVYNRSMRVLYYWCEE